MDQSNEKGGLGAVCALAAAGTVGTALWPLSLALAGGAWLLFKSQKEDDDHACAQQDLARYNEARRQAKEARLAFLDVLEQCSERYRHGYSTLEECEAELAAVAAALWVYAPGAPAIKADEWGQDHGLVGDFWNFITFDEVPFLGVKFDELWIDEARMEVFNNVADIVVQRAVEDGQALSLYDAVRSTVDLLRAVDFEL